MMKVGEDKHGLQATNLKVVFPNTSLYPNRDEAHLKGIFQHLFPIPLKCCNWEDEKTYQNQSTVLSQTISKILIVSKSLSSSVEKESIAKVQGRDRWQNFRRTTG